MEALVSPAAAPRRGMDYRTVVALFLATVAAILGAVPGWSMCFAAWLVFSWLVLGGVALSTTLLAIAATIAADWHALRNEARQVLNVGLLMLVMLPLGLLSIGVEFAFARAGLVARAEASARAGGPAIAMTPATRDDWPLPASGFVYDRDGVLATPPARRPAAWNGAPVVVALAGECVGVSHFFGAYYRWSSGCDGL